MELEVDSGSLREQPLSPDEKQVLSEYFQLEGQRQFDKYRSLQVLSPGSGAGLFSLADMSLDVVKELSDKQLTLELSQREHWVDLIKSIHSRFYELKPTRPEIMLWVMISLEKHAIVQIETGQEEFQPLLQEAEHRQLRLINRLGEPRARQYGENIDLFYKLLEIDGLTENLIRL